MATETLKRDSMDATTDDNLAAKLQSTSISNAPSTAPSRSPPSLTTLPTSIRNNIYAHLLDTELVNLSQSNVSYTHSLPSGGTTLSFRASRPPLPIATALFAVNRQISSESLTYFYTQNLFVRFEIYSADARHAKSMLEDSGVLFSTASPDLLQKSTRHALDLTIVEKNSEQKRAVVMFPAQYLPRLVNFWDQATKATKTWAKGHTLYITMLNTYTFPLAKLQGDMLELFRLLSGFAAVTVEGSGLLDGYADALAAGMMAEKVTADAILDTVTAMTARGDEAFEGKKWELAHQHARSAIITLTYGYLTHPETLHMQPDTFHKSIQRLRWRCELLIGRALLAKHETVTSNPESWISSPTLSDSARAEIATDMLTAETATSQALSLATDSPSPNSNPWFQSLPAELIPPNKGEWFTDEERGSTWYACGLVHTAVGECLFAAGDLERASGLAPDSAGVEAAFATAREGIDWEIKPGTGLRKVSRLGRG